MPQLDYLFAERSFPGWRRVGWNEALQYGSVFVGNVEHTYAYPTPEQGYPVDGIRIGMTPKSLEASKTVLLNKWEWWTKDTGPRKPKRIPLNAHYSSPLPLP